MKSAIELEGYLRPDRKAATGHMLIWTVIAAALIWSFGPSEMYNARFLVLDAGNMVEFASEFLSPDFHDGDIYLAQMLITINIAVWGTAVSVTLRHFLCPAVVGKYRADLGRAARAPPDGRLPGY